MDLTRASHPLICVVRLLAQGSVVVLVIAFGWWGMWKVGSDTLSSQRDSLTAERSPIYVVGVRCLIRLRRARREGVLARAGAVLRKAPLTRSPHVSREWD